MMNAIVVDYDPFAMESRVSIVQEDSKETVRVCSGIEELSDVLVGFAYGKNVYSIKVSGPLAITSEIKRMVQNCEKNLYSKNQITVEGI